MSALGFGVGLGFKRVPAALVEVAREHGFPVFAVPYETPFREIIHFVDSSLTSGEEQVFRRLTALQRYLVDALRTPQPERAMVDRLAQFLDASVVLAGRGRRARDRRRQAAGRRAAAGGAAASRRGCSSSRSTAGTRSRRRSSRAPTSRRAGSCWRARAAASSTSSPSRPRRRRRRCWPRWRGSSDVVRDRSRPSRRRCWRRRSSRPRRATCCRWRRAPPRSGWTSPIPRGSW